MPNSLKAMIKKLANKGCISSVECDELLTKLNGHDEKIRAEERAKTIKKMSQIIRKIEADTSHCLFDCPKADDPITCTICTLERAIKQMEGNKND